MRQGVEIVISDRKTPIARLVPYRRKKDEEPFSIIEPPNGYGGLRHLDFPDMNLKVDPVKLLIEERRKR